MWTGACRSGEESGAKLPHSGRMANKVEEVE
jgi:hypothetical protein